MQQVSGYPTDLLSTEPNVVVTHNGVVREVDAVSLTRELGSSLPAQASAGSSITAATGSITWSLAEDTQERSDHPWKTGSFPPKPGDSIAIDVGYGDALVRVFTGLIDDTSGSVASNEIKSKIVDGIDRLKVPVSLEALQAVMPPNNSGGEYRYIGITPTFFTDKFLRAGGFFSTPAQENACVFSATLMGSAWPERGRVRDSSAADVIGSPSWVTVPWGQAAYSLNTNYTPAFSPAYDGRLNQTMQMSFCVDPAYSGGVASGSFTVWWAADYVRVSISATGSVIAESRAAGVVTEACRLAINTSTVFTLRVSPAGVWTLRSDNGREITGNVAISMQQATTAFDHIEVFSGHQAKYPLGGVQVCFTSVYVAVNHVRNTSLTPAAHRFSLKASPAIESRSALQLLKEQATAECAAMTIDEWGNLRWTNRDILTTSPPVTTFRSSKDLQDIGWESSTRHVRAELTVTYMEPLPDPSRWVNKLAWQGPSESMEAFQTSEYFVEPPADVDWVMLDTTFTELGDVGSTSDFNRGWGSFSGGIITDGTAEAPPAKALSVVATVIDTRTIKIKTSIGALPAGNTFELRTSTTSSSIWPKWLKQNLPILRCGAITTWHKRRLTGANTGPITAAAIEHDVGWWIQDPTAIQTLADWLSLELSKPKPVIRSMEVAPEPRLQLADIATVEDQALTGLALTCLAAGISLDVKSSESSVEFAQSLMVRVLDDSAGVTNAEMDEAYRATTNQSFDTAWAPEANAVLDSDPLRKA
ncbi:hypothetical protein [Arthrobacter sp. HLT1-21]